MHRSELSSAPTTTHRQAFTLIEMMIVVFIIAILVALSVSAVMKFMGSQLRSNTQATLDRTQALVNKAWSAEKDDALNAVMSDQVPGGGGMTIQQWIQANLTFADANAAGRMRVLYVKLRLRRAFPMNFAEVFGVPYNFTNNANQSGYNPNIPAALRNVPSFPLPPLAGYIAYLANYGITQASVIGPGYTPQSYESSICLLMALQRASSGGGIDLSSLTSGGAVGNVNVGGQTIPCLVDAWGTPLYFSRAPVGYAPLNAFPYFVTSNPLHPLGEPGINDPGDPQGYLQTANWATSAPGPGKPTFGHLFAELTLQQLAGANRSYKIAPLIASAGPNTGFEMDPVTFARMTVKDPISGVTISAGNHLANPPVAPDPSDDMFSSP
jgi:prepilin-type N-terminal cleavage/methylation domain-containing protein